MKKKIFIIFVVFSLLFLIFTQNTRAACAPPPKMSSCPYGTVTCPSVNQCCSSASECPAPPSSTSINCTPTGGTTNSGINTAIGCVPVLSDSTGTAFMGFVLKWALGIGGGIAFLLILYGGFMVMTSAGNPERLKAGQELLTSAISGLLLLIFSIVVLKFIGIDILQLGLFGFGR